MPSTDAARVVANRNGDAPHDQYVLGHLMDLIFEVAMMIIMWTAGLALAGAALSIVLAGTFSHDERKRNWRRGSHDYYGNELPTHVRRLSDSDGV